MASALAAFARSLGTNSSENQKQKKKKQDDDGEAQLVESDDEVQEDVQVQQASPHPNSLVDVPQLNNSVSTKPVSTLADFAKQQGQLQPSTPALSLLQVAQQQDQEARLSSRKENRQKLTTIAAELTKEDAELTKQRSDKIQSALQTTSEEVRAQVQAKQRQAIEQAVQQAIAEKQQYQQDDAFEAEGDDDPAIQHAAQILIAKVTAAVSQGNDSKNQSESTAQSAKPNPLAFRSVDRHVLKQWQNHHGLQSKSTSKAKTMRDKLSSFQFHQLSLTQRRLFLATLVGDDDASGAGDNNNKKTKCSMDAINELAKDKTKLQKSKRTKKPEFAKFDDNRNCRFRPRFFTGGQQRDTKSKGGGNGSDDEDNNSANQRNEDFVRRMEAAERAKNEQLRRTREEQAYLAHVDKKARILLSCSVDSECPACGNPQSYSELSQKRKKCPNCGVTYKSRVAWSDIANQFLERMEQYLDAKLEAKRKREEQQLRERDPHRYRHYHGRHRHHLLKGTDLFHSDTNNSNNDEDTVKTWEEVQDEFLGRVQLDLMHRALSKDVILQELQKECSFTPAISNKAKRLNLGTFDERLRRDLENRKARQDQYKLLAGAIAAASAGSSNSAGGRGVRQMKMASNKSRRVPGFPPPANFQERLRLDLEKRREREQDNNFDAKQQRSRPKQTQIKW